MNKDIFEIVGFTNTTVSVQLRGSSEVNEGRVEVSVGSFTGTVCDDLFDDHDAIVVCSMLGYRLDFYYSQN